MSLQHHWSRGRARSRSSSSGSDLPPPPSKVGQYGPPSVTKKERRERTRSPFTHMFIPTVCPVEIRSNMGNISRGIRDPAYYWQSNRKLGWKKVGCNPLVNLLANQTGHYTMLCEAGTLIEPHFLEEMRGN